MSDYPTTSTDVDELPLFGAGEPPNSRPKFSGGASDDGDGKCKIVLARLKDGPLSTYEAERVVHRGQAVIKTLRNRGHIIDTLLINGSWSYVYRRFEKLVAVTSSMQEAYYATRHWTDLALQRKEIDCFQCRQCGRSVELQTHHWRYRLFEESVTYDLITFCKRCHLENIHEAIKGSGIHFPRSVPESVAVKLGWSA